MPGPGAPARLACVMLPIAQGGGPDARRLDAHL